MKFKNTSKPNVVCFPDFGLGGIICTILNQSQIQFHNERLPGSTKNYEHNALKGVDNWNQTIEQLEPDRWYGTHAEYGNFPTDKIGNVIQITTEQVHSRFIIFLRAYRFLQPDWEETDDLDSIDPIRELAKQYAIPYVINKKPGCFCVELCDLCYNPKILFEDLSTWNTWAEKNSYIYQPNTWVTNRFNEALWETTHGKPYQYS